MQRSFCLTRRLSHAALDRALVSRFRVLTGVIAESEGYGRRIPKRRHSQHC